MSNAAVVFPFPSPEQLARENEDRILADYLRAKRDEAEAKRRIDSLKGQALAILRRRGEGFAASGLGSLSIVEASAGTLVDMDAIKVLLEKHGEALPVKPGNGGGPQLRASLLK